jgi:hypothetical protein
MRRLSSLGALLTAALTVLSASGPRQASAPPAARDLLREIAQVTDGEWATVMRGEPIAKVLATDSREVAVAGAVRIAAASERLAGRYREIEHLKRGAVVLALGRFSTLPQPDDLVSAPLEDYDLDLRDCRPGNCRVRLGEPEIARFHREVDWRAPDWRERSRTVWREVLAGYAAAYSREGRRALPTFVNKPEPLHVPADVSLLVKRFEFIGAFAPAYLAYLREFGPGGPAGLDEVLYWSKEDFGVRAVLRLSHQTIYRPPDAPRTMLIATNQIYANHYLDAGLTLTMAIDAADGDGPAFHMIAISRVRTRSLSGLLRTFVRSTVENRSRDALRKILAATKASLEQS